MRLRPVVRRVLYGSTGDYLVRVVARGAYSVAPGARVFAHSTASSGSCVADGRSFHRDARTDFTSRSAMRPKCLDAATAYLFMDQQCLRS